MGKQRKTRSQKEETTERRAQFTYSFTPADKKSILEKKVTHSPHGTAVTSITHDLQKTVITSLLLVILQVILFYLLQHHMVKIPGVSF
jgi:hypothetical protein